MTFVSEVSNLDVYQIFSSKLWVSLEVWTVSIFLKSVNKMFFFHNIASCYIFESPLEISCQENLSMHQ